MKIGYVTNSSSHSGVGVREHAILQGLRANRDLGVVHWHIDGARGVVERDGKVVDQVKPWPGKLGAKSINWIRLGRRLRRRIAHDQALDIIHLANQTLSFMIPLGIPTVLTVHDIIELLEPQSGAGRIVSRYLYRGIRQADHVVSVSEFTKQTLIDSLNLPDGDITVSYNGVGDVFCPIASFDDSIANREWRSKLRLAMDDPVALYVGSDHPRKNVTAVVEVLAHSLTTFPDLKLVKVGGAGLLKGRKELLARIDELGVRDSIRFVGDVDESALSELYNLADVLVYPSRFEGFGLPPLQAMATGTPVITSNATSLPEVVGDDGRYGQAAAKTYDPDDVDGMAHGLLSILSDRESAAELSLRGCQRAKQFSWDSAVEDILKIYAGVLSS